MAAARATIAPGHWLAPGPAASWRRMTAGGMPSGGITEAGRTRARQEYLYGEYLAGRLVAYAALPGLSLHESGYAIDVDTRSALQAWLIAHGAEHGWWRPLLHARKPEPWHWEYRASHDRHLTDAVTPLDPITPTEEDDEMPTGYVTTDPRRTSVLWLLSTDLTTKRHLHSLPEAAACKATGAVQLDDGVITAETIDAAAWTPCHAVLTDGDKL